MDEEVRARNRRTAGALLVLVAALAFGALLVGIRW
jgi:hypothetical protein